MRAPKFIQSITFKIYPQAHTRADGKNTIYLRVTIERRKKEINLHVHWPVKNFDQQRQVALPRFAKDAEIDSVNMVIEEARGRANRIKLRYFTEDRALTLESFVKEFDTFESRDNFLFYWNNRMQSDFNASTIGDITLAGHKTNLNRLKDYVGKTEFLSIGDIDQDFLHKFYVWLIKKKKLKYNSAVKALKTIHVYYNKAKTEGYNINEDAFAKTPKSYRQGERDVLEQGELMQLIELYDKNTLPDTAQEVLRKFLFSCYTGLRISDSAQVDSSMIKGDKLTISTKKGARFGKELVIKLSDEALQLIAGRKGLLFTPIADPVCNRWLKAIAAAASVDKKLTFHVSRDTFATLFIASGGDVVTLKDLMGHSNITTTQIYTKMSEKRADTLMDNFAAMLRKKKPD